MAEYKVTMFSTVTLPVTVTATSVMDAVDAAEAADVPFPYFPAASAGTLRGEIADEWGVMDADEDVEHLGGDQYRVHLKTRAFVYPTFTASTAAEAVELSETADLDFPRLALGTSADLAEEWEFTQNIEDDIIEL